MKHTFTHRELDQLYKMYLKYIELHPLHTVVEYMKSEWKVYYRIGNRSIIVEGSMEDITWLLLNL